MNLCRILMMEIIKNNMDFVAMFESLLCDYTKFQYAVCVDSCTNAIIISLEAKRLLGQLRKDECILKVPSHTYLSIPMSLARNGWKFEFVDHPWREQYSIGEFVIDAATAFKENLGDIWKEVENCVVCVSFQQKKRLSLDQGGVIFTNSKDIARICRRLRHDGRDSKRSHSDEVQKNPDDIILGWHAYMSPEKAAKGILLLNQPQLLPSYVEHGWQDYPDISHLKCFEGVAL